jgi:hypothetical protein
LEEPLGDPVIGVNPAVTEEGPVAPHLFDAFEIDLGE